jgi:hypothetical protein
MLAQQVQFLNTTGTAAEYRKEIRFDKVFFQWGILDVDICIEKYEISVN